jgi:hypothetical protein
MVSSRARVRRGKAAGGPITSRRCLRASSRRAYWPGIFDKPKLARWVGTMELLSEYLEHALTFERLAADEANPKLKADLERQAKAYRKLAAERAAKLGLPPPSTPSR